VVAGQSVSKGDLGRDRRDARRAPGRAARIDFDFAERELARRRLLASQLATNADLDAAAKGVETSRAALEALGGGCTAPSDLRASGLRRGGGHGDARGGSCKRESLTLAPTGAVTARVGFEPKTSLLREGGGVLLAPLFADVDAKPASARCPTASDS
jgi:hypothetical protein